LKQEPTKEAAILKPRGERDVVDALASIEIGKKIELLAVDGEKMIGA
jgi:hypothetical protein